MVVSAVVTISTGALPMFSVDTSDTLNSSIKGFEIALASMSILSETS